MKFVGFAFLAIILFSNRTLAAVSIPVTECPSGWLAINRAHFMTDGDTAPSGTTTILSSRSAYMNSNTLFLTTCTSNGAAKECVLVLLPGDYFNTRGNFTVAGGVCPVSDL